MAVTLVKPYCLRELPCDLTCVIRKAWWPFPRRLALKPASPFNRALSLRSEALAA